MMLNLGTSGYFVVQIGGEAPVAERPFLMAGPWMQSSPTADGKKWVSQWKQRKGRGKTRVKTWTVGVFEDERDADARLDERFAEYGIVMAPAGHEMAPTTQRSNAFSPRAVRVQTMARERWQRLVEREAAEQEALRARAAGETPAPGSPGTDLIAGAALPSLDAGDGPQSLHLPADATVVVVTADGTAHRLAGPRLWVGAIAAIEEEDLRAKRLDEYRSSEEVHVGDWLLSGELWGWIERNYAASTHKGRRSQLRKLAMGLPNVRLAAFATVHVERYQERRRKRGLAARTVNFELEMLRAAFKAARRMGLMETTPEVPKAKWATKNKRPRISWTLKEYEAALATALPPVQTGITRGRPPRPYSHSIHLRILLGVEAILRPGEITHAAWEDVQLEGEGGIGWLAITDKPSVGWRVKTRRAPDQPGTERRVPMSRRLTQALADEWEARGRPTEGWLFPRPKDPSRPAKQMRVALDRVCADAGVRHIRPVELRHTGATFAVLHRGFSVYDLQHMGGWASAQIPMTVYAKSSVEGAARKLREMDLPERVEPRVIDLGAFRKRRRG